jgi:hypothetical protein
LFWHILEVSGLRAALVGCLLSSTIPFFAGPHQQIQIVYLKLREGGGGNVASQANWRKARDKLICELSSRHIDFWSINPFNYLSINSKFYFILCYYIRYCVILVIFLVSDHIRNSMRFESEIVAWIMENR